MDIAPDCRSVHLFPSSALVLQPDAMSASHAVSTVHTVKRGKNNQKLVHGDIPWLKPNESLLTLFDTGKMHGLLPGSTTRVLKFQLIGQEKVFRPLTQNGQKSRGV